MARQIGMQPKATVAGRSFVFNVLFVVLNIAAVACIVIGFHRNFEDNALWLSIVGFALLAFSIGGLVLLKGRMMMNNFSRVFVGSLFIVSGLVKANDPVGFSYKLQEYFEDGALAYRIKVWFGAPEFSLESLSGMALGISVFICVIEIVLGVMTIFRQKMKWVSVLILGMMLFFTFLTWHTANCDSDVTFLDRDRYALNDPIGLTKIEQSNVNESVTLVSNQGEIVIDELKQPQCVNDCGCFGDAMKGSVGRSLTPSESLWKDLVLLYFAVWLVVAAFKKNIDKEEKITFFWVLSLVLVGCLSWVFGWVFPFIFALILFVGSIWFLRNEKEKKNLYWKIVVFVTILTGLIISYVLMFEPIKDYRPYAKGSNLKAKMSDGKEGKYVNTLVYKNISTGEIREYDGASAEFTSSKIWEDKKWKYIEMFSKEIVPMKLPSITEQFDPFIDVKSVSDIEMGLSFVKNQMLNAQLASYQLYSIEQDSLFAVLENKYSAEAFPIEEFEIRDTTIVDNPDFNEIHMLDEILTAPKMIVLIVRNITEADWTDLDKYKLILKEAKQKQVPMLMLTSSSQEELNKFRADNDFDMPVFRNDETELKAIARSNPSMMILKKGVVIGKYPHRAMPDFDWLIKNDLK